MWPLKSGKKAATHASIAVCTMGPASGRHALDIDAARCICAHTLMWHATQNRSAAWIVICGNLWGSSSFLGFLLRLSSAFLTRDPKQIEPNTIQEARPIAHAHELRTSFKLCATRVCFGCIESRRFMKLQSGRAQQHLVWYSYRQRSAESNATGITQTACAEWPDS